MSIPEDILAGQLRMLKIPHQREYRFAPPRKFRADFLITEQQRDLGGGWRETTPAMLLIEVDGGAWVNGRHSRGGGVEADAEKSALAAIHGYRMMRCTPAQVESGECVAWIEAAMKRERAA
jgi:hypothetical protein